MIDSNSFRTRQTFPYLDALGSFDINYEFFSEFDQKSQKHKFMRVHEKQERKNESVIGSI